MIYFSPHIRALEAQIEYLKARLEKAEQEKRDLEQERRNAQEAARVREDALLQRLAKAEETALSRADALLDRVLIKNNVAPVAEPPKSEPVVEIVTPYANMGSDMERLYKESYIAEEVAWLMREDATIDEGTAHAIAEENYIAKHQVMK